jgi:hypothetical protein
MSAESRIIKWGFEAAPRLFRYAEPIVAVVLGYGKVVYTAFGKFARII